MTPKTQISDDLLKALSNAFSDPIVAKGITEHLIQRQAEMKDRAQDLARRALYNPEIRPAALVQEGVLKEVTDMLDIVNRFMD